MNKYKKIDIITYNIKAGLNLPDKKSALNNIIKVLRKSKCEIIGLNEVDCCTGRSQNVDQAKYIAEKLDYDFYFGKAIDYDGGKYGNAILSKYPISSKTYSLPYKNFKNWEPRSLILSEVYISEIKMNILVTHFPLKKRSRIDSVSYITEIINNLKKPIILMGDFNADFDSKEVRKIKQLLNSSTEILGKEKSIKTFPAACPKRTLDYIFVSSDINVVEVNTIDTTASDHLPLKAAIEIQQ